MRAITVTGLVLLIVAAVDIAAPSYAAATPVDPCAPPQRAWFARCERASRLEIVPQDCRNPDFIVVDARGREASLFVRLGPSPEGALEVSADDIAPFGSAEIAAPQRIILDRLFDCLDDEPLPRVAPAPPNRLAMPPFQLGRRARPRSALRLGPASRAWRWGAIEIAVFVLFCVGLWRAAPLTPAPTASPRPRASLRLPLAFALLAALDYARLLRRGGPYIGFDELRDLFRSLDIAQNHTAVTAGPSVAGFAFSLAPAYYDFLSLPLRLGAFPYAVLAWHAAAEIATVVLLYTTARRLFSGTVAALSAALVLASPITRAAFDVMTHSNWSLPLVLLAIRALYEFQIGGRTRQVVPLFLWTSLAIQLHFSAAVLVPLLLLVVLIGRRAASPGAWLAACLAGVLPLLPTVPAQLLAIGATPMWPLAWVQQNSALLPVALVAAVVAMPWLVGSRRGLALTSGVLASWLAVFFIVRPETADAPLSLRLFQMYVDPRWLHEGKGLSVARPRASDLVDAAFASHGAWSVALGIVVAVLAAIGLRRALAPSCRALRGGGRDSLRRDPAALAGVLLFVWILCTLPTGIAACFKLGLAARYLAQGSIPVAIATALGVVDLASRGAVGRLPGVVSRHPAATVTALAAIPIVISTMFGGGGSAAGTTVVDRRRLLSTARFVTSLRRQFPLDADGLAHRVHGVLDDDLAFGDPRGGVSLFSIQLAAIDEAGTITTRDPRLHYRLVTTRATSSAAAIAVSSWPPLHLSVIPYVPALHGERVQPLGDDGVALAVAPLALPFRADATASYADALHPRLPIAAHPLDDATEHATPLRYALARDVPTDPRWNTIELLLGPPPSQDPAACRVDLAVDGRAVPLRDVRGDHARRYRFVLPPQAGTARVVFGVAGCSLVFLDAYDVDGNDDDE